MARQHRQQQGSNKGRQANARHVKQNQQRPGAGPQTPQQNQQSKLKKPRYKLPYLFVTDPKMFELRFYEQYDESYLFNKAVTLMFAVEQGEEFKQRVQAFLDEWQGGTLSDKYFASLKAELFFMTLHQFEAFFALLIAPVQQIPTWVYLTAYTTDEMKTSVRQFLDGGLAALTEGFCHRGEERRFLSEALYLNSTSTIPEQQARWDENLDNAAWLIHRVADAYLANLKAYNSYKHGLRAVTRQNAYVTFRLNDAAGNPTSAGFTRSSEDALSYLELQETDKGTTIHETTKFFNPTLCFFYVVKLHQMMETIKLTRLAALRGSAEGPRLNMFLSIDKNWVMEEEAKSRFEFTMQV